MIANNHSATLIDNIFLNSLEHFTISGNLIYDLTDHLPNFLIVSKSSSLPENIKVFRRDYSKFDEQALINDIQSIDKALSPRYVFMLRARSHYERLRKLKSPTLPVLF